ncbi:DUF2939 domain-containing protein [Sphingomonas koreensis]|nr:DUF2939 domain-containing protein [Sphingomonas koreensis]
MGLAGALPLKTIFVILALVVVLFVAAYAASPLLAVRGFVGAARSGDADRLEANVDFPAVRESLKSRLGAALMGHIQNDPEMKDNPFAGLATMMGPAIVDRMIDTIITPDGIAAMVRQGKLHQDSSAAKTPAEHVDYGYSYLSLDRFRVTLNGKDAANPLKLIFERRGLFSWKLVKIDIPDSVFDEKSAADASPSPPAGVSDLDYQEPPADLAKTSPVFLMPTLPTPVEQVDCHMGECTWQQINSISDVKQAGDITLRVVRSRIGTTETPDGEDYPTTLTPGAEVTWRDDTSYDLCSIAHPASLSWDASAGSYLVTPLDVASPAGYQMSAVAEYKLVCHNLSSNSSGYQHPEQLGYIDTSDSSDQYHVKNPEQIIASAVTGG